MWHIIRKDLKENASTLALAILAGWLLWLGLTLLPWAAGTTESRSRMAVMLLVFAVPVVGAMLGADSMARELDRDTLPLLLSRPVSRSAVWAAKWLGGLTLALSVPLGLTAICWVSERTFLGDWTPHGAGSAGLGLSALLLTATCFSLTFLAATQIRRRLDAVMAGALANAILLLAHRRLAINLEPFALMLTMSFAAAAYWTLRRGESLDSQARHVAAASALAVSLGLCLTAVQSLHWLETSVLVPQPERISSAGPYADGSVFVTVATQPRWTNLFRTPDTRVARISLDTGAVSWLPLRWARCELGDSSPLAEALEPSQGAAAPLENGRLLLAAIAPNLGYPCGYSKPAAYDLASRTVSWPGQNSREFSLPLAAGASLRFLPGDPAGPGGLAVHLSKPGVPEPQLLFSGKNATLVRAWRDGEGVAYLKSELARLVLIRHAPDGHKTSATTLCELPSGTSSMAWATVLVPTLASSVASVASSGTVAAGWKVVHAGARDARNRYRLTLVRPEASGLDSAELTGPILLHEPPQSLPGGGFLLYVLEAANDGDWHGVLLRFDRRGAPSGRLDLGSRVRVSASRLSPDRRHLVAHLWTGKSDSDRFMLLDVEKMTLAPLLAGRDLQSPEAEWFRRLDEWLFWLDDRRLLQVTAHTVSLVDLDGNSPPRQLAKFE
jgi:hypothetical protein